MKKMIPLLLCVAICLSFTACKDTVTYAQPITFYYPASSIHYDAQSAAIVGEIREGADYSRQEEILAAFLEGPLDSSMENPFPVDTRLVSYEIFKDICYVTLSDEFAMLTGLELTIACCCIAKTCLALAEVQYVSISAEKAMLDGEKSILLSQQDILLLDQTQK